METSNTYRADSAPAHGGHHLVDGLMRCDACWGVCLPQWRCRCCLTTEIDKLRAQVQRVRWMCNTGTFAATFGLTEPEREWNRALGVILRALDGTDE